MIMSEECEDDNGGNGLASVLLLPFLQCVLAKKHIFGGFFSLLWLQYKKYISGITKRTEV